MSSPPGPPGGLPPYRVVLWPSEADRLRRWLGWARQCGGQILGDFLQTANTVQYRLQHEPLAWGDPNFTYRHLGLEVRFGTYLMFNVRYLVSEATRIVYVQRFLFVKSYPLGQPLDE